MKRLLFLLLLAFVAVPAYAGEKKFVIACDRASGAICNSWEIARIRGFLPAYVELVDTSNTLAEMVRYLESGQVQAVGHPNMAYRFGLNSKARGESNEAVIALLTTKRPDSGMVVNRAWFKAKTGKEPEELRGVRIPGLFAGSLLAMNGCDFPSSPPLSAAYFSSTQSIEPPKIRCGAIDRDSSSMTIVSGYNVGARLDATQEGKFEATNITFPALSILEDRIKNKDAQSIKSGIYAPIADMPAIPTAGLVVPANFFKQPESAAIMKDLACAHVQAVRWALDPANKREALSMLREQLKRFTPSDSALEIQLQNLRDSWLVEGVLSEAEMDRIHRSFFDTHERIRNPALVTPHSLTIGEYWKQGRVSKFHDFSLVPDYRRCS